MLTTLSIKMQEQSLDRCLETQLYTCDRFIQEDCSYHGDVIRESTAADAMHCQQLCKESASVGCEYWRFQQDNCTLLTNGSRICSVLAGPKSPPVNYCPDRGRLADINKF